MLDTVDDDGAHTLSSPGASTAPPPYAQAQPIVSPYLANMDDHTHSAVWQADANKNFLTWLRKDVLKVPDEDARAFRATATTANAILKRLRAVESSYATIDKLSWTRERGTGYQVPETSECTSRA